MWQQVQDDDNKVGNYDNQDDSDENHSDNDDNQDEMCVSLLKILTSKII